MFVSKRFLYDLVVVALDLFVLKQNVFWVDQAHVWWVQADVASHEKNVLELVHLAVRPNIWSNICIYTFNVQIILYIFQLSFIFLIIYNEICYDFISRNLNANSHRRFLTKILNIFSIQVFELAQVGYEESYFDNVWQHTTFLYMVHDGCQLFELCHLVRFGIRIQYRDR